MRRFECIDIGYGDEWYITDNGERLSEMEIVDLLNQLHQENEHLIIGNKNLMKKNEQLKETNEKLQQEFRQNKRRFKLLCKLENYCNRR